MRCAETEITLVQKVKVDACIANEIVLLNACGVRTEGYCTHHCRL